MRSEESGSIDLLEGDADVVALGILLCHIQCLWGDVPGSDVCVGNACSQGNGDIPTTCSDIEDVAPSVSPEGEE